MSLVSPLCVSSPLFSLFLQLSSPQNDQKFQNFKGNNEPLVEIKKKIGGVKIKKK